MTGERLPGTVVSQAAVPPLFQAAWETNAAAARVIFAILSILSILSQCRCRPRSKDLSRPGNRTMLFVS